MALKEKKKSSIMSRKILKEVQTACLTTILATQMTYFECAKEP